MSSFILDPVGPRVLRAAVLSLLTMHATLAEAVGSNLLPDGGFENFEEADLAKGNASWGNPGGFTEEAARAQIPVGWTVSSWNQAFVQERFGRGKPGRTGSGSCLEMAPAADASTIGVVKFVSKPLSVAENRAYFFNGYYASTCERVAVFGEWFDADEKSLGKFEIRLPDTQDEWIHFTKDLVSPDKASRLVVTLEKKWQKGRVRFDDLSLREGKLGDFLAEFGMPKTFKAPFFPIFAWMGPAKWPRYGKEMEAYFDSDAVHLDYVLAGFNVGYSPRFGTHFFQGVQKPEQVKKLDIAKLDQDPEFWAFHGKDEPSEELFPQIAEVNELLRAQGATRPYWINLLPTYGFPSYEAYENHVREFMRQVPTKLVTFDHYTLQEDGGKFVHRRDWFANLEIFRRLSLEHGVTWGIIVQLGAWGGQPTPDENALRWQVFNSLVYGAKALGWFCYLTEIEYGGMNWRNHAVDREGFRTANYTKVRRLNHRIHALGETLLRLTSTGVYHSEPLPELTSGFGGSKLVTEVGGGEFVLGEFLSSDGTRHFMISNRNINQPASAELRWRTIPKEIREVGQTDGVLAEVEGFQTGAAVWSVHLAPGEGRLFQVKTD